jgi:hypothetical protein
MSLYLYKVIHLLGVILLFLGLASALMPEGSQHRKIGLRFHGIGLILLLLGGFGLIAKMQIELATAWWVWAKLVLWLGFGAMPLIGKRGLMPTPAAWTLAILFGLIAILLGATQGQLGLLFSGGAG